MGFLIISRTLILALACSFANSLVQLTATGDDNDCALYLSGPGRTSAYDYSLNLLKGNFGYDAQHTCITYDAVNQAYLEARNRIVVSQPKGEWKAEDFASAGELILDISINLARRYGLTYEEIEKGLPLIDTSKTLIRDICPPVFSHVECRAGKYRRFDGLCNNLQHPTWGSTMAPFQRLLGPLFADGINAPRIAHTGRDLPLSRVVSRTMHPDEGYHDHAGTVMVIAWGQFMDHDYTLTGTPLDPINRNDPEECCKRPPHLKHPYCNEIRIPEDDRFYGLWNVKCIDFVRAFPSPRPGCRLGSRVPFNTLTGVLDGNTVYGVTDKFSRKLRTGFGGLLRMNPVFKEYGLKDLLPLKLDIPDEGCTRPNNQMYCFEAGEIRVNEQLVLTVMHTLMAREHNRIAKALAHINPHWDDETLFQEARRINIAEIQHITYNEFLPILLGKDVMDKFGLVLEKEGYWDGYDPHVNPDVIDAFASAAFRFGHSLLPTAVERWSKAHKFIASKRLSDLIRRPFDLYRAGVLDEYVMGLMNQVAQAMDDSITQEVTNHLFKKVGARFGMDLVSFNMQRGREFGIPGYMEFRKFCGLKGANTFQDLFGAMPNETVRKYESIFEHPIDVDLWSGGVSERPLPGSMLGPTFACVIATQFSYSRRGDRFWYELPNQPSSFTPEQLTEIRKARLARIICDNTDIIDTVQLYPMVLPDHELNPRVPCRSGIIPSIDFSAWAEPAPFHGPKPFITEAYVPVKNETEVEGELETTKMNDTNTDSVVLDSSVNGTENDANINQTYAKTITQITPCNGDTKNCTENVQNCSKCQKKLKETHGTDTVLKYVYKKDERTQSHQKPSGHPKNNLKRRRRSSVEGLQYAASAPLIVNYKTFHEPRLGSIISRPVNNIIKDDTLADFNIETLHDSRPYKKVGEIKNRKTNEEPDNRSRYQENEKSDENEDRRTNLKPHEANEDSADREEYVSREKNHSGEDSSDSNNDDVQQSIKGSASEEDSQEKDRRNNRDEKPSRASYNKADDSQEVSEYRSREAPNSSGEDVTKISSSRERDHSEEKNEYRKEEPRDSRENFDGDRKPGNRYPGSKEADEYINYDRKNIPHRENKESGENSDYRENDRERKSNHFYPESKESSENKDRSSQYRENDQSEEKSDYRDIDRDRKSNHYNPESKEGNENKDRNFQYNQNDSERKNNRYYPESEESKNDNKSKSSQNSEEINDSRGEKYYISNSKYLSPSKDSNEGGERSEESSNLRQTSRENVDSRDDNISAYSKPRDDSFESKGEEYSDEKLPHPKEYSPKYHSSDSQPNEKLPPKYHRSDIQYDDHPPKYSSNSKHHENEKIKTHEPLVPESEEEEAIIAIMKRKPKQPLSPLNDNINNKEELNSPVKIRDVDLGDFANYERIHVNDKGIIEPIIDTNDSYDTLSVPLIKPLTTTQPETVQNVDKQFSRSTDGADVPVSTESNEESGQPVHIDDEEVKPVVEFNSDKEEHHEENSKEALKANPNEDTSLETLLGVKESNDDEKSDNVAQQEEQEKGDVKQQFERIPLNYNHAKKEQQANDEQPKEKVNNENSEPPKDDPRFTGTIDTFIPKPINYDEHLSFKFDDTPIKLPEIKLPEDVLAFPHEDHEDESYTKKKEKKQKEPKKQKFYHYNEHEYNPEPDHDHFREHDDHEPSYYNKYNSNDKKEDYRKNKQDENDDEEEDLYEKFVRERFGKTSKFDKRSEKLTAPSQPAKENDQLFQTLNQVLKKAANIEKEAQQSGDPNAGYLWTVEYSKPL